LPVSGYFICQRKPASKLFSMPIPHDFLERNIHVYHSGKCREHMLRKA